MNESPKKQRQDPLSGLKRYPNIPVHEDDQKPEIRKPSDKGKNTTPKSKHKTTSKLNDTKQSSPHSISMTKYTLSKHKGNNNLKNVDQLHSEYEILNKMKYYFSADTRADLRKQQNSKDDDNNKEYESSSNYGSTYVSSVRLYLLFRRDRNKKRLLVRG